MPARLFMLVRRFVRLVALAWVLAAAPAMAGEAARPLKFQVNHGLSRREAHRRMEQLLAYWRSRFEVRTEWEGERAHVTGQIRGIQVDALLVIGDAAVGGEVNDPGFFLRRTAYAYIHNKLLKYLHPAYMDP